MDEQENDPHDIKIEDHIEEDNILECGYCGHIFEGRETKIEKIIYGRKWVFCSEECLQDFMDASNFREKEEIDYKKEDGDEVFEMKINFSGPEIDDDYDDL